MLDEEEGRLLEIDALMLLALTLAAEAEEAAEAALSLAADAELDCSAFDADTLAMLALEAALLALTLA